MSNPPGMVGRRARKCMSGAANDSTTKFSISGKVPLEWLMHRLASPSPGHAQTTLRGNSIGGVSRPSNVRASDMIKSYGCGVPSLIVSSAPRPNLSVVWVVDRWVWMLLLVRNGHVSGEMVVCVGRLHASCIELSSRTTLQCPPLVAVEPKGRARCPECVDRHDSTMSVHRCSIVLSDAEYLLKVGSRPCSLVACAFLSLDTNDAVALLWPLPYLGSMLRTMRDGRREGMLPG
ncbi:hypothetical protein V6N13_057427 [Hibiscus sabdariffa]